jgi:hypothetical protein
MITSIATAVMLISERSGRCSRLAITSLFIGGRRLRKERLKGPRPSS